MGGCYGSCGTGGDRSQETRRSRCIDCGGAGFPHCSPVLLVLRLAAGIKSTEDPWLAGVGAT